MVEYVNALVALYGSDEAEGQGLVEYALILGLISIIAVVAVTATGVSVAAIWGRVQTAVAAAATA